MIAGRNIQEVIQEILRRSQAKKDYIIPTDLMQMKHTDGRFTVAVKDKAVKGEFDPTSIFHDQLGGYLEIPGRYYDRLRDKHPDILLSNVNGLLATKHENRMIRTLDGKSRALLSDKYRRLDDEQIAAKILPVIENRGFEVKSTNITETRFYMQVISPKLKGEIKVGDVVQGGWTLRNSEIGQGALCIEPLIYRLACKNGMVVPNLSMRKTHLGRRQDVGAMAQYLEDDRILSQEALRAADEALWLGVRDTVDFLTSGIGFDGMIERLQELAGTPITGHPEKVVKQLAKSYSLQEHEELQVLRNLVDGNSMDKWGLANAVTALANDHVSYDRAFDLEVLGGTIMNLDAKDWSSLQKVG